MSFLHLFLLAIAVLPGQAPEGDLSPNDVSLKFDLSGREVRGSIKAPVLLVEFSDYKCHACERFSLTIMPELTREFIEPGKLAVTFVDFPLTDDTLYTPAAAAVHCAGKQKSFWRMHDLLWQKVPALNEHELVKYAGEMGLDVAAFQKCLAGDETRARVLSDLKLGNELGVGSRPTFFIGHRQPDGTWRGQYMVGSQSYLVFKSVIGKALAAVPVPPTVSPETPGQAPPGQAGLPGYEGSDLCIACHASQHDEWSGSLHARTIHRPTETETALISRALLCGDDEPLYVLGEKHSRRFMVASSSEKGRHLLLPCRYDTGTAEWVSLHENDWKTLTWEKSCGACHTAGFSSDSLSFREMGVGCEACHGPASRHGNYKTRDAMISFSKLKASEEVTICASCHLQGGRSRATGLNYARNYRAGDDLFADYSFDWTALDKPAPDAGPIDLHQKLLIRDVVTKGREDLRCSSCHEFHKMGHARHEKLARTGFCQLCHNAGDFKLKEYNQSCNVCEF